MKVTRKPYLLPALIALSVASAVLWLSAQVVYRRGIEDLHVSSSQQLQRFVGHLEAQLSRFAFVPELLSKNRVWVEVLRDPGNPARIELTNRYLEEINTITGAADTYLMDTDGLALAASNWQSARPFVGQNFAFRPYFQQAIDGRPGRYFALGTTSAQRGYYFAYPLRHAAAVIGVVVLKMDLADVEAHWSGRDAQFLVTDPDGIVFITTRPDWLYRSTKALSAQRRAEIEASRRYPGATLEPLTLVTEETTAAGGTIMRIDGGSAGHSSSQLVLTRDMPEAGWTVQVMAPTRGVTKDVATTVVFLSLLFFLAAAIFMLVWQRRRRRLERERFAADAKRRLEQDVVARTTDLTREIEERRRTEGALRETQDELIQAAKLAVLGQLSASISHELNNPLAAIRSYADNARQFLAREQDTQVDRNLHRISHLTDRMAKISSQLKFFARKSSGHLEAVSVRAAVTAAVDIVQLQSKRSGTPVTVILPNPGLEVRADVIQLEQVLINLLSNAIQAMEGASAREVTLSSEVADDLVLINVDDVGPGVAEDNLSRIFDPFFTTRKYGLGLGLSISYRIMESMHGRLSVKNLKNGGARFTVALPMVEAGASVAGQRPTAQVAR